jgi:hypothetical protein
MDKVFKRLYLDLPLIIAFLIPVLAITFYSVFLNISYSVIIDKFLLLLIVIYFFLFLIKEKVLGLLKRVIYIPTIFFLTYSMIFLRYVIINSSSTGTYLFDEEYAKTLLIIFSFAAISTFLFAFLLNYILIKRIDLKEKVKANDDKFLVPIILMLSYLNTSSLTSGGFFNRLYILLIFTEISAFFAYLLSKWLLKINKLFMLSIFFLLPVPFINYFSVLYYRESLLKIFCLVLMLGSCSLMIIRYIKLARIKSLAKTDYKKLLESE